MYGYIYIHVYIYIYYIYIYVHDDDDHADHDHDDDDDNVIFACDALTEILEFSSTPRHRPGRFLRRRGPRL